MQTYAVCNEFGVFLGWGPLRLCLVIIHIRTNVDSNRHYSSCRSHYSVFWSSLDSGCSTCCWLSTQAMGCTCGLPEAMA